jgi:hypothetical protein
MTQELHQSRLSDWKISRINDSIEWLLRQGFIEDDGVGGCNPYEMGSLSTTMPGRLAAESLADRIDSDAVWAVNRNARKLLAHLHGAHLEVSGASYSMAFSDSVQRATGLDYPRFKQAGERLVERYLAERGGHAAYRLTPSGVETAEDREALERVLPIVASSDRAARRVGAPTESEGMSMKTTRIFISHSSVDAEVAKALISLIKAGLEVPSRTIRCTSVDGHKLDGGDVTAEALRADLVSSNVVLGVLTRASVSSSYVLMELGAAWALKKRAMLLIGPGATYADLPGPFKGAIHALKMDHTPDTQGMIETIARETGFAMTNNLAEIAAMSQTLKDVVVAAGAPGVAPAAPFRS